MGAVSCGQTLTISATLPSAPVFGPSEPWDPEKAGSESYVVAYKEGMAAVKANMHDAALPLLYDAAEKTMEQNDVVMYNLGRVLGHIDGTNGRRPVRTHNKTGSQSPHARLHYCIISHGTGLLLICGHHR